MISIYMKRITLIFGSAVMALALPLSASAATVVATLSPLTLNQEVTIPGSNQWQKSVVATPGDSLSWMMTIKNTSKNNPLPTVVAYDKLPAHLQLIPGSVMVFDSKFPNGQVQSDTTLFGSGLKLDTFAPNTTIYVRYRTIVKDDFPASICKISIGNTASATAKPTAKTSTKAVSAASATISRNCTPVKVVVVPVSTTKPAATPAPLPATGSADMLTAALGVTGLGYATTTYVRSRRSVKNHLRKQ